MRRKNLLRKTAVYALSFSVLFQTVSPVAVSAETQTITEEDTGITEDVTSPDAVEEKTEIDSETSDALLEEQEDTLQPSEEGTESEINAILYGDGELVFSNSSESDDTRTVAATWNNVGKSSSGKENTDGTIWCDYSDQITSVTFKDKISQNL